MASGGSKEPRKRGRGAGRDRGKLAKRKLVLLRIIQGKALGVTPGFKFQLKS